MGVDKIEAASFFGTPAVKEDALLEGSFVLAGNFTGSGGNWRELASHAEQEFQLTSKDGILRLLKMNVADAIPEVASTVKDAIGSVGHAVGDFLQIKRTADAGKNPVSASAEAVLDFTTETAEIGYDQLKVTARRTADDGTLRLTDIAVISPDLRLTGTGRIDYRAGQPIPSRPLTLDLHLAVRDQNAELLQKGALLSGQKDDLGYSIVGPLVHFGGTLAALDGRAWHDLLARGATHDPPPKK